MLWFPPNISRADFMVADTPIGEKWWVGAEDAKGKLITAWSQRPDAPDTLAQLKSFDRVGALREKVLEKLSKSYRLAAKWDKGLWIDTSSKAYKILLLPPCTPFDTKVETRIGNIRLMGRATSPTETILLELYQGVRPGDTSVRLDHYEFDKHSTGAYPIWQTVYANELNAMEAVDAVISRREKIGYIVEHRDVSRVSFTNPLIEPIPFTLPGAATLIWDF